MSEKVVKNQHREVMKVTADGTSFAIDQEVILNALEACEKIVPKSNAIPILKCIKFDLTGDKLFVTAMDATQSIMLFRTVENLGGQDGTYLFPAKEGIELVKRLPRERLIFHVKGGSVHLTYGLGSTAKIKVLDSEEYPQLPKPAASRFIDVPIAQLRKGILSHKFASNDEKTLQLSGINIYSDNGKIAFIATDRHRVLRYESECVVEDEKSFTSGTLPAHQFKSIVDSFKDIEKDKVALTIQDNYLILRGSSMIYFGRTLDGTFPSVRQLMSFQASYEARVPKDKLDDTLNRSLSLDIENYRVAFIRSDSGELVIKAESQMGIIEEVIPGSVVAADFTQMKFNAKYLRDVLFVADRDVNDVLFHFVNPTSPVRISYDGDPSLEAIVLPVR